MWYLSDITLPGAGSAQGLSVCSVAPDLLLNYVDPQDTKVQPTLTSMGPRRTSLARPRIQTEVPFDPLCGKAYSEIALKPQKPAIFPALTIPSFLFLTAGESASRAAGGGGAASQSHPLVLLPRWE